MARRKKPSPLVITAGLGTAAILALLVWAHLGLCENPSDIVIVGVIAVLLLTVTVMQLERRRFSRKLDKVSTLYETLLSNIEGGVVTSHVLADGQLRLSYVSSGWTAITGYTGDEIHRLFGSNPSGLILAEDWPGVRQSYAEQCRTTDGYQMQYRVNCKDGTIRWVIDRGVLLTDPDGKKTNQSILTDITSIKEQEERLLAQAQCDPLTSLYNKVASQSIIDELLVKGENQCHALFMLDIDDFKGVNDTLGHLFGDSVLISMAARMRKMFREHDVLGRVGGDEFVIFMPDLPNREVAVTKAEWLCQEFRRCYEGKNGSYVITCSVGVAFHQPGQCFFDLYQQADTALYQAKLDGRNRCRIFDGTEQVELMQGMVPTDSEANSSALAVRERIFELLYGSVDFSGSVNMVLALLGDTYEVSRVYVFEASPNRDFLNNTYEWCNTGITPMIDQLQHMDITGDGTDGTDYFALFGDNDIFCCGDAQKDVSTPFQGALEGQDIYSMLQVRFADNCGLVGFDDCKGGRSWSPEEQTALAYTGKLLATFILKKRATDQLLLATHDRVEALDNLPNSIYVTDKDGTVAYMNNSVRRARPNAKVGDRCYKAFMENDAPCKGCPAHDRTDDPKTANIYNKAYNSWYLTTAAAITWAGQDDMCLVCCQNIGEFMKATEGTAEPPKP